MENNNTYKMGWIRGIVDVNDKNLNTCPDDLKWLDNRIDGLQLYIEASIQNLQTSIFNVLASMLEMDPKEALEKYAVSRKNSSGSVILEKLKVNPIPTVHSEVTSENSVFNFPVYSQEATTSEVISEDVTAPALSQEEVEESLKQGMKNMAALAKGSAAMKQLVDAKNEKNLTPLVIYAWEDAKGERIKKSIYSLIDSGKVEAGTNLAVRIAKSLENVNIKCDATEVLDWLKRNKFLNKAGMVIDNR